MKEVSHCDEPVLWEEIRNLFWDDIKSYIRNKHPGNVPGEPGWVRGKGETNPELFHIYDKFALHEVVSKYWKEYNKQRPRYLSYKGQSYRVTLTPSEGMGIGTLIYRLDSEDFTELLNQLSENPIKRFFKGLCK